MSSEGKRGKKGFSILRWLLFFAGLVFVLVSFWMADGLSKNSQKANTGMHAEAKEEESDSEYEKPEEEQTKEEDAEAGSKTEKTDWTLKSDLGPVEADSETIQLTNEVTSGYAVFLDLTSNRIVAQKEANTVISPASMTKIMTVLVAAEQNPNLDEKVTITQEVIDYSFVNECSAAGFVTGDEVTVRDLFYGTILPSGGEAAAALAIHTAGSLDEFAVMMNEKLEELGLSETAHFTNCVGLYDENHYCTVYDMAMILRAAMNNELCRAVMSARTYQVPQSANHPDGILLSNWFLRRIEDKDTGAQVRCAKTGYVEQSGNCSASFGTTEGNEYICVTAKAAGSWECIDDHVALYKKYSA